MQVTYIKESRASRGGLMMTKQGWWMLAWTASWTWVGPRSGGDTVSRIFREGGKMAAGREGGRDVCSSVCRIHTSFPSFFFIMNGDIC